MTEAEWLACNDPTRMLAFLRGTASDRKLRLYLCGGCRHIAHLFFRPESLASVEVAERLADGLASEEERHEAHYFAESPTFGFDFDDSFWRRYPANKMKVVPRLVDMGALPESALRADEWQVNQVNQEVQRRLWVAASLAYDCTRHSPASSDLALSFALQVDWPGDWLFECVFGNPFRAVRLGPSWLAWNDGAIRKIAEAIYEARAFCRLPLLADALEEAGCTDADILSHCRSGGEHVRGCWVVDLLLGKS